MLCLKKDEALCKTIPGKFQTYCAYKLPIIGAADGEIYKIVNENQMGFMGQAGDFEALAKNILKMKALSKNELSQQGANARVYYAKCFERNAVLHQFEKKLLEIIK